MVVVGGGGRVGGFVAGGVRAEGANVDFAGGHGAYGVNLEERSEKRRKNVYNMSIDKGKNMNNIEESNNKIWKLQ